MCDLSDAGAESKDKDKNTVTAVLHSTVGTDGTDVSAGSADARTKHAYRPHLRIMPMARKAAEAWPEASWTDVSTGERNVPLEQAVQGIIDVYKFVQRRGLQGSSFASAIVFAALGPEFLTPIQRQREPMFIMMMHNCGEKPWPALISPKTEYVRYGRLGIVLPAAHPGPWSHPVTCKAVDPEDVPACFEECTALFPAAPKHMVLIAMRTNLRFVQALTDRMTESPPQKRARVTKTVT